MAWTSSFPWACTPPCSSPWAASACDLSTLYYQWLRSWSKKCKLTGELRELFELLLPCRVHIYDLTLLLVTLNTKSHLFGSLDELVSIVRVDGSKYGEEILSWTASSFRISIWKILSHPWHLEAWLIQLAHRYLIVVRRVTISDLRHLEEIFVTPEDLLQIIGGDHLIARHEILPKYIWWLKCIYSLTATPSYMCKMIAYLRRSLRSPRVVPFEVSFWRRGSGCCCFPYVY